MRSDRTIALAASLALWATHASAHASLEFGYARRRRYGVAGAPLRGPSPYLPASQSFLDRAATTLCLSV